MAEGADTGLGRQLWELVAALRADTRQRFAATLPDVIAAHELLLRLAARGVAPAGEAGNLRSYRDYLTPIFAKTADQREYFRDVFDKLDPGDSATPTPTPTPTSPGKGDHEQGVDWWKRRSLFIAIAIVLLLGVALILALMQWQGGKTAQPGAGAGGGGSSAAGPATIPVTAENEAAAQPDALARLVASAGLHDGAPTLAELARDLAASGPVPMPEQEYLRRLQDLTGFAPHRPLPLMFGVEGSGDASRSASAEVLWAIEEIEQPGNHGTLAEERARLTQPVATPAALRSTLVALAADSIHRKQAPVDDRYGFAVTPGMLELSRRSGALRAGEGPITAGELARARAIADPTGQPATWLPQHRATPLTPAWVPWLLAVVVAAMFAPPLRALLNRRAAFLRQRPPRTMPHRSKLVQSQLQPLLGPARHFSEIRKAMQRREPIVTRSLDVPATVAATLREGGKRIVPRYATLRSAPEYLVLIDRRSLNDLEAERARRLFDPLRGGSIGFDLFWFDTDPTWCAPEGDKPPVRIEELVSRFPEHRLLVVGDGLAMIDLFAGRPAGGYVALQFWLRRGLLTPVPRADWAREEWLVAERFKGPIAASSSQGLMAVSQVLLTDLAGRGPQLLAGGGPREAALPPSLAADAGRFTTQRPPRYDEAAGEIDPVARLLVELEWYLGRDGFAWLCALAVYPSVSFDLTLYLGARLKDARGRAVFDAERLAAITRLPWLRAGRFPEWLRARLIAAMPEPAAAAVRRIILDLIAASKEQDADPQSAATFGREGTEGERLFRDEVMVDFLLAGEPADFALERGERDRRAWRDRVKDLGWLQLGAILLAAAFVIAAVWVAPGEADGPAPSGLWLASALLVLMAGAAAILLRPMAFWRRLDPLLRHAGRFGFYLAGLSLAALLEMAAAQVIPGGGRLGAHSALANLALAVGAIAAMVALGRLPIFARWFTPSRRTPTMQLLREALAAGLALVIVLLARQAPFPWLMGLAVAGATLVWHGQRPRPASRARAADDRRLAGHEGLRRAAPLLAGLVLLAIPLAAALALREDRPARFAAEPGSTRVIATADDGTVALTQDGGRSVDITRNGSTLAHLALPAGVPGRIIRLAVGSAGQGTPPLLAATSEGTVYRSLGGQPLAPMPAAGSYVPGSIRLAAGDANRMAAAGAAIGPDPANSDIWALAPGGARASMLTSSVGRVSALEFLGDNLVYALTDGGIGLVTPLGGALTGSEAHALAGGARMIRRLPAPSGQLRFIAIAEDGTSAIGTYADGRLRLAPGPTYPSLAVGPVIPWQSRRVEPAPAVEETTAQGDTGKPGKRPIVAPVPPEPPCKFTIPQTRPVRSGQADLVVYFDYDQSSLNAQAAAQIEQFVSRLRKEQGGFSELSERFIVQGHTDAERSPEYSVGLSERMANSVRDLLMKLGVPAGSIVVEARGLTQPRVPAKACVREPGNRRVEINVVRRAADPVLDDEPSPTQQMQLPPTSQQLRPVNPRTGRRD